MFPVVGTCPTLVQLFRFTSFCLLLYFSFSRTTVLFLRPSFTVLCPLRPLVFPILFFASISSAHLPFRAPPKGDNTPCRLSCPQSVRVILLFFSYLCNMRPALISIQLPQHVVMTMFPIRNNAHSPMLSGIYGATRWHFPHPAFCFG